MRDRMFFELSLCRFGVWQGGVWLVCSAAVATMVAWAATMFDSLPPSGRALVVAVAACLSLAAIGLALSLARVAGGLLTCSDGLWMFAPDTGARRTGTLEVAMDLGAFLLLRTVERRRTRVWLPVQRRGVETGWHALRCAVYSPPPPAAGATTAPALPAE